VIGGVVEEATRKGKVLGSNPTGRESILYFLYKHSNKLDSSHFQQCLLVADICSTSATTKEVVDCTSGDVEDGFTEWDQ